MDFSKYRERLQAREQELTADLSRTRSEAVTSRIAEVEDPMDLVTSLEAKAEAFRETNADWESLQQVQEALARIEAGTYGRCTACGREIPAARLDAAPWTPYCIEDQERHEKQSGQTHPHATL